MEIKHDEYIISDKKEKLQVQRIKEMLSVSYWAKDRTTETILKTIENSICFGIYDKNNQIGFARCVTDYSTMFWLGDVIIDDDYRGRGLGKVLMKAITTHEDLKLLRGILETDDAHGLYEQYGFVSDGKKYMCRKQA